MKTIFIPEIIQLIASYLHYYNDVKALKQTHQNGLNLKYNITIKENQNSENLFMNILHADDYNYKITGLILQNFKLFSDVADHLEYLEININDIDNIEDIDTHLYYLKHIHIIGEKIDINSSIKHEQVRNNLLFSFFKDIPKKVKVTSTNNNELIR